MDTQTSNNTKPATASSADVAARTHAQNQGENTRTQWVKAVSIGIYDNIRRRVGSVFLINPRDYGTKWMVAVNENGEEDPARCDALTKASNATRLEVAAQRLQDRNIASGQAMQRDPKEVIEERFAAAKRLREAAGIKDVTPDANASATNEGNLVRGGNAHPDTGSAPSSGIGTNLNPAPYGQQAVDKAAVEKAATAKSPANKNVL